MTAPFSRDRHGRGPRGPLAWPPVPAMASRRDVFDDLVREAGDRVRAHLGSRLGPLQFGVEEVPGAEPAPWEPREAALGRVIAAPRGHSASIIVYRRPILSRCEGESELAELIHEVVVEQIAALLGVPPSEVDPRGA